ncbi:hypothetical protein CRUP_013686 [Coryphaenoides rupestris]|nr:hypothetical protein CRUP_013686 [Coryphaenoides rupestris]
MCTEGCSRVIAIALYVLAGVSMICNIILFFPDFSTDFSADQITEEARFMGGFIGGGVMVLIPAIHIHLTSSKGCCNNRCGPEGVVEFNLTLFSILLMTASVELMLCLFQMVNGLFGCICGTCAGDKVRGGAGRRIIATLSVG